MKEDGMVPRVLTVEDEPDLRLILQDNLEFEGYEVLTAATGEEGLDLAMAKQPDLVLLDLLLPRMSGYEVCRRLRAEHFTMPIIMLTARNAEMDKVTGLELGADDYVGKPFGVKELLARVRVQLRRPRPSSRQADEVRVGEIVVDLRLRRARAGSRALDLSSREFELLEYLLDHADRVVTREELLRAVWGYGAAPLTRTVDNFVAKLRKKVECDPRNPRHILTVHGSGYRLVRTLDDDGGEDNSRQFGDVL
jgi:DNA-binding response OmpR family regulator